MANISQYLSKILKAVYGEEVRGSIHDAINAMNSDLTYFNASLEAEHKTNESEVSRLDGRIDAVSSGQPTPISTAAEMLDHSKVYLYTGNETGYTAGHFYWYSGDDDNGSWIDGGEYGSSVSMHMDGNTLVIQSNDQEESETPTTSDVTIQKIKLDSIVHDISLSEELTPEQIIQSNIRKCLRSFVGIRTFGYHEAVNGSYRTGHMSKGAVVKGIPYSSVFWNESDVLWNRNPASFYSAALNPASKIYQGNIWEILYDDSSTQTKAQGNYFGSMCSGLAGKTAGCEIYYTTREMMYMDDRVRKLEYTGVDDMKIGTIFVMWSSSNEDELEEDMSTGSGHAMVVYDISRDDNGKVIKIAIAEEAKPCTRLTYYTPNDFDKRIREDGYVPCEYIGAKPELLPEIEYATDIIPEFGDRTWYRVDDPIWMYISNGATTIYYKTASAESYTSIAVSELTSDTVTIDGEAITVYDVQPLATTPGDYYFTTDSNTTYPCIVSVINTGSVSIFNVSGSKESTATVAGYSSNLAPLYYSINYLVPSSAGSKYTYAYPAPSGYVSKTDFGNKFPLNGSTNFTFMKPFLDERSVTSEVMQNYAGYVVQVFFKHKYGMPCAWSYVIESYIDNPEENS